MIVLKIADQDVADKIDTAYIAKHFTSILEIGITFICTEEGGAEDDWIDEDGIRQIVIHLPYKEVKRKKDIRPMMLAKAMERMGMAA
ncbi:MAG: hypothetical protein R3A50_16700 [Saprospiraceae bacterium]